MSADLNTQEGIRTVKLPSGAALQVHESELQYFRDRARKYQTDNVFFNISDIQDLDRLLTVELLCYRYGNWILSQRDYWDEGIVEKELNTYLKSLSIEVREIKESLGLDKSSRDKQRGEDSMDNFLTQLKTRAKEFGYMRNEQAAKAIELMMEIQARITLMENCDEQERVEQHCRPEDVLKWLSEEALPEFHEIDRKFRETTQKMWIRNQ